MPAIEPLTAAQQSCAADYQGGGAAAAAAAAAECTQINRARPRRSAQSLEPFVVTLTIYLPSTRCK